MPLWHRRVDLVVVTHCVRRLAVLARHPSLDIRRLSPNLVAVGVDYYCCI